jgi:2-polyprenyl-3-methyl-5-hydroxy-6-metoxy-1,4-benzoquinol methylase
MKIEYLSCGNCHNFFQNTPITKQACSDYYADFYRFQKKFGRPEMWFKGSRFHLWTDYLLKETNLSLGGSVLDVGCAEGFLVRRLIEKGIDAFGIVPAQSRVRYATEDLQLKTLKSGTYRKDDYSPKQFDAITFYHVIEHVIDASEFLETVSYHLKDNGYLLLATPSVDAVKTVLKEGPGNTEVYERVFENSHPIIYSLDYLKKLLTEKGFEVKRFDFVDTQTKLSGTHRTSYNGDNMFGMSLIAQKRQ